MSRVIQRFEFKKEDGVVEHLVEMPVGSTIVSVVGQGGFIVLFAEIDTDEAMKESKKIRAYGTGTGVSGSNRFMPGAQTFLGTVIAEPWGGHLYEAV